MSRRQFIWLTAAAILAVLAVVLVGVQRGNESPDEQAGELLFPGLAESINDVTLVEVITAGSPEVATLVRHESGWALSEWHGYPVDWPKLQTLLADFAQARIVQTKTDNPEYFDRLGVGDVASAGASGTAVRLTSGEHQILLIVGNSPTAGGGRYVRRDSDSSALQVDGEFSLPGQQADWVSREIVDISAGSVREVEILHPDGDRVLAHKPAQDLPDFLLTNLPDNRTLASSWSVNQLGSALSALQLEAVRPVDDVDWGEAVRFRLQRFDGLELIVSQVRTEGEPWIRLEAAAYPPANGASATPGPESEALNINTRSSAWAYRIAPYRADPMVLKLGDLLAPPEAD